MARLLECFSPLVGFGLALDALIAGGRAPDCAGAQRRADELIEEGQARALAAGKTPAQIESARFAMVAWLDEVFARHPDRTTDLAPLETRLFNSNNAETEFFHHLSLLQLDDDEVREVYWEVLALGFRGQYYFEDGDGGELGKLKALHGQQLALPPLALDTLAEDHITPQPYAAPDPPGPRDPQSTRRAALRAAAAMALLIPFGYWLWFLAVGPREAPPTLAQRVDQQLQSYACADLAASVGQRGVVQVKGFVADADEMARVQREVRALPGMGAASFDLQLRVWPHCEVVALLKPFQQRNLEQHPGLAIAIPTARGGHLREGDPVQIEVTNAARDGYLWVDYYNADGSVIHLNAGRAQPRRRAGETAAFGRDMPSSWLVAPPFGAVLLTALFSPTPFEAAADRPPYELASAYLQWLRESLSAEAFGSHVVAELAFFETVER